MDVENWGLLILIMSHEKENTNKPENPGGLSEIFHSASFVPCGRFNFFNLNVLAVRKVGLKHKNL